MSLNKLEMKVLIVYAHPSENSFTYEVLKQLEKGILEAGMQVEVSDLYKTGFTSDMSEAEYERESGFTPDLPVAEDVKAEHLKLAKADCVCFVYPVWWSDCPAKMKGWFDRVWSAGYAYSKSSTPRQMSQIKQGMAICTAGHTNQVLEETGIAQSMTTVMLDDRFGDRFNKKDMVILGGTMKGKEAKEALLEKACLLGKEISEALQNNS